MVGQCWLRGLEGTVVERLVVAVALQQTVLDSPQEAVVFAVVVVAYQGPFSLVVEEEARQGPFSLAVAVEVVALLVPF